VLISVSVSFPSVRLLLLLLLLLLDVSLLSLLFPPSLLASRGLSTLSPLSSALLSILCLTGTRTSIPLSPSNAVSAFLFDFLTSFPVDLPVEPAVELPAEPAVDLPADLPVEAAVELPVDLPVELLATAITSAAATADEGTLDDVAVGTFYRGRKGRENEQEEKLEI
jgi:hypothetical protein